MREITTILLFAVAVSFGQFLHVDSVTVDSVWNSDSSWYDRQGIFHQRYSRDCIVAFMPMGQGTTQCEVALSIDSGRTWAPSPNPLIVLDNGIASPIQCGTKGRVELRVLGQDRANVVFRITGRQYQPVISGDPRLMPMGITGALTPGNSCGVMLKCKLDNVIQGTSFAPIAKVWWDGLADGNWEDSTSVLTWAWQTTVPTGAAGQRRAVIVKARDLNGLWSVPCTLTVQFGLQRPLNMVSIPGGTFQMGSNAFSEEQPIHSVTITAFKMAETNVTQELYMAVLDTNPSQFGGDTSGLRPVEQVSWYEAAFFCNALSKVTGKDTVYRYTGTISSGVVIDYSKNGYRLPTEAEWEYACRAGSTSDYYWGKNYPDSTQADTLAMDSNAVWCHNSNGMTQPVASKKPNAWGLYDMSGNVWQWMNDCYGGYTADDQIDPTGPPKEGGGSVQRAGSWYVSDGSLRSSYRRTFYPAANYGGFGFRLACRP